MWVKQWYAIPKITINRRHKPFPNGVVDPIRLICRHLGTKRRLHSVLLQEVADVWWLAGRVRRSSQSLRGSPLDPAKVPAMEPRWNMAASCSPWSCFWVVSKMQSGWLSETHGIRLSATVETLSRHQRHLQCHMPPLAGRSGCSDRTDLCFLAVHYTSDMSISFQ